MAHLAKVRQELLPESPIALHAAAEIPRFHHRWFEAFLQKNDIEADTVVAIKGVSALFGILKVKEVVDKLAPMVAGRLLVFFPGSYENNNYRLLDGYDGWNYLAVPITADKEY